MLTTYTAVKFQEINPYVDISQLKNQLEFEDMI